MPGQGQYPASNEDRIIEIDTERVLKRQQHHFGVIDVGSNSVRLVVYDDLSRSPFPRFNEKSLCALGAGLGETGRISEDAIDRTVRAIQRLVAISQAMEVESLDVIATEAARRASNGVDLLNAIRNATGLETTVLSGQEEATYAALGVISGFFKPKGLVGDIGGGSLEVSEIISDRVGERMASMPLGALPVKALMESSYAEAKSTVDEILRENLPPLLTDPVLYAVGGGWRALARVHIAMNQRPISVVHGYELAADEARDLAKKIAKMSPDDVASLPDVPSRRIETLPAAALVMFRVLKILNPEKVVFSAFGLREGWLYAKLDRHEQYLDPLLEGAKSIGIPTARVPAFSAALARWTDGLFPGESQTDRRLRLTVCALTDMAWRDHAKVRAQESFLRLLQFPFIGVTHPERAFIAVAVMARYGGKVDDSVRAVVGDLLSDSQIRRAMILGHALLLGHRFSASVPEILEQGRLRIEADTVRLEVLESSRAPDSASVNSRLEKLAKTTGVDNAEIVEVDKLPPFLQMPGK